MTRKFISFNVISSFNLLTLTKIIFIIFIIKIIFVIFIYPLSNILSNLLKISNLTLVYILILL